MSDMKVGLSVTATGKQAQRELRKTAKSSDALGRSVKGVGAAAAGAGAKVKKAAREQSEAVRKSARRTTEAMGQIKRGGSEAGRAIRQGMREGVRAERDATRATDRLGTSMTRMIRRVGGSGGAFRKMARMARSEINSIKRSFSGLKGQLALFGVGFGVARGVQQGFQRHADYIRMQQTVGMTAAHREAMHKQAWEMQRKYGVDNQSVTASQGLLLSKGYKYQTIAASIPAISKGALITGATPSALANALSVGHFDFNIDLNDPKNVAKTLNQMIAAGRGGGIEVEDMVAALPTVAREANLMDLDLPRAMTLLEVMGNMVPEKEKAARQAMAGLKLFTNAAYRKRIEAVSGDHYIYYDKQGNRKTPEQTLKELRRLYAGANNARARDDFLGKVTKGMDSMVTAFLGSMLKAKTMQNYSTLLATVKKPQDFLRTDLPANLNTAITTEGRMKGTFGQLIDEMSRPIDKAFTATGNFLLDRYSGKDMLATAAGAGVVAYALKRFGGPALSKLMGGPASAASTMRGIAVGHTLHEATGTLPVFVTNWSGAAGVVGSAGLGGDAAAAAAARRAAKRAAARGVESGAVTAAATADVGAGAAGVGIGGVLLPLTVASIIGYESVKHEGEMQNHMDRNTWASGGRYDSLQPMDEHRHLSAADVAERKKIMRDISRKAFDQMHVPDHRSLGQRLDDSGDQGRYVRWVAKQADAALRASEIPAPSDQQRAIASRQAADVLDAVRQTLAALLGQPLHIEVTTDNPALHAQIVDHAEREARRG